MHISLLIIVRPKGKEGGTDQENGAARVAAPTRQVVAIFWPDRPRAVAGVPDLQAIGAGLSGLLAFEVRSKVPGPVPDEEDQGQQRENQERQIREPELIQHGENRHTRQRGDHEPVGRAAPATKQADEHGQDGRGEQGRDGHAYPEQVHLTKRGMGADGDDGAEREPDQRVEDEEHASSTDGGWR